MGLFDNYPTVNVGSANGSAGGININGQEWASSPQVNGYPQAAGGAVVTAQVGRKQVILGVGGFYPNQTGA